LDFCFHTDDRNLQLLGARAARTTSVASSNSLKAARTRYPLDTAAHPNNSPPSFHQGLPSREDAVTTVELVGAALTSNRSKRTALPQFNSSLTGTANRSKEGAEGGLLVTAAAGAGRPINNSMYRHLSHNRLPEAGAAELVACSQPSSLLPRFTSLLLPSLRLLHQNQALEEVEVFLFPLSLM
jgi:hypothetical protein